MIMETNKIIILDMLPTSTGKLHSSSRIVDGVGIAPTILARDYKDPTRVLVEVKNENRK